MTDRRSCGFTGTSDRLLHLRQPGEGLLRSGSLPRHTRGSGSRLTHRPSGPTQPRLNSGNRGTNPRHPRRDRREPRTHSPGSDLLNLMISRRSETPRPLQTRSHRPQLARDLLHTRHESTTPTENRLRTQQPTRQHHSRRYTAIELQAFLQPGLWPLRTTGLMAVIVIIGTDRTRVDHSGIEPGWTTLGSNPGGPLWDRTRVDHSGIEPGGTTLGSNPGGPLWDRTRVDHSGIEPGWTILGRNRTTFPQLTGLQSPSRRFVVALG